MGARGSEETVDRVNGDAIKTYEKEGNAMDDRLAWISYALAAAASICFVSGVAVLTGGKGHTR